MNLIQIEWKWLGYLQHQLCFSLYVFLFSPCQVKLERSIPSMDVVLQKGMFGFFCRQTHFPYIQYQNKYMEVKNPQCFGIPKYICKFFGSLVTMFKSPCTDWIKLCSRSPWALIPASWWFQGKYPFLPSSHTRAASTCDRPLLAADIKFSNRSRCPTSACDLQPRTFHPLNAVWEGCWILAEFNCIPDTFLCPCKSTWTFDIP